MDARLMPHRGHLRAGLAALVLGLAFPTHPAHAAASFSGLGYLPGGFESYASGVSADGSVVVGSSLFAGGSARRRRGREYSGGQAFRWTSSSTAMQGLGDLPGGGAGSAASGVSADGLVVVGIAQSDAGPEAFRWESGVLTGLGDLPGGSFFYSYATSVSGDGSV